LDPNEPDEANAAPSDRCALQDGHDADPDFAFVEERGAAENRAERFASA
jgi:hypothetical protein